MEWTTVTKQNPCPICEKPDWCFTSKDGLFIGCRRVDTGEGKHKVDRAGVDYWVYYSGTDKDISQTQDPEFKPNEHEIVFQRAEPETLNEVYEALLKKLNLSRSHKENLINRGLNEEEIKKRQYRTLPLRGRAQITRELIEKFGEETCFTVPGFIQKRGRGIYWTLAGPPGILIPLRDTEGKIVALKVRRDDGSIPKYLYISSNKKDFKGPSPGTNVHVPIFEGSASKTCTITEGELKADVITYLSGTLAISLPGVSCWRQALPVLKQLKVENVRLAFDADIKTNKHVAQALYNTWKELKNDFNVELAVWAEEKGKGLDDLLAAGKKPEILNGQKADQALVEIVKRAYEVDPPQNKEQVEEINMEDARMEVEKGLEKLRERPKPITFYQDTSVHEALAALPAADQAAYRDEIKTICPEINKNDMKKVIREASERGKRGKGFFRGLVQQNNQYFIEKEHGFEPLSNFILEPTQKIIMPDGSERLYVDVFMGNDDETPACKRILSTDNLLGRRELLKALGSVSAQWLGSDYNVQQLIGYLAGKDVETKKGAPYIGHFENRFITPGNIITAEGEEKNSKYTYMHQNVVIENYIEMPDSDNWHALAKKLLKFLPQLQEPALIWPLIGWFFAAPAAPIIRKQWGEFPILHVWGTAGGGKTSLIQVFLNLLGITAEPFSAGMKKFALIKTLAATNALPIFLDEYRPLHFKQWQLQQLHELLLLAYKGSIESRGKPDQTTVEYPLHAPLVLAGEAPLPENENGLGERVVQLQINRNFLDKNPEAEEAFNEITGLDLKEFAQGFITWLLRCDVPGYLKKWFDWVSEQTKGRRVPIRVKHNISAVFTGIGLFVALANQLKVDIENPDVEGIIKKLSGQEDIENQEPKCSLDRFMLGMEVMAHENEIKYDIDYTFIEDDEVLIFYTNGVVSKYNKWAKFRDAEKINDRTLQIQLKENAETKGYILSCGKRRNIGNTRVRCTFVDAKKLENKLGISVDTWKDKSEVDLFLSSTPVDKSWDGD